MLKNSLLKKGKNSALNGNILGDLEDQLDELEEAQRINRCQIRNIKIQINNLLIQKGKFPRYLIFW
jgi:hypothetical protein